MKDLYEYTILSNFLPAIINDDWTGLDDNEEKQLRDWITARHEGMARNNYSFIGYEYVTCTNFARCEITGLLGEVSDLLIVFNDNSIAA